MFKKLKVALAALLIVSTFAITPVIVHAGEDIGAGGLNGGAQGTTYGTNQASWFITQYINSDINGVKTSASSYNCIIGAHVTPYKISKSKLDSYVKSCGDKKKAVNEAFKRNEFTAVYEQGIRIAGSDATSLNSFYLMDEVNSNMVTAYYNYNPVGNPNDLYNNWISYGNNWCTLKGTLMSVTDLSFYLNIYGANNIYNSNIWRAGTESVVADNADRESTMWFYGSTNPDDLPSTAKNAFKNMTKAIANKQLGVMFKELTGEDVIVWFVEPILSSDINLKVGSNTNWQPYGLTPYLLGQAVKTIDQLPHKNSIGLGDMFRYDRNDITFLNFCNTNGYAGINPMENASNGSNPDVVVNAGTGAYAVVIGYDDSDHLADMPEIPSIPIFYKDKDGNLTYSGSSSTVTKEAWNEIYPVLSYALHLSEDEPKSSNLYNDNRVKYKINDILNTSKQAKDENDNYTAKFINAYNELWGYICDYYHNTFIDISTGSVPKRVNNNDPTTVTSLPGDSDGPFEIDTTLGTVADTTRTVNALKTNIYAAHPGDNNLEIVHKTITSMSELPTPVGKKVSVGDVLKNPYEYAIVIETGSDIVDEDGDPEPPNIVVYDEDGEDGKNIWNTSIPKEDFNAFKTDLKYAKGYPDVSSWTNLTDYCNSGDSEKASKDNKEAESAAKEARKAFEVLMNKGSYKAYNENPRSYLNDSGWEQHAQGTSFEEIIEDSAAYYNSLTAELDHWNKVKEADNKLKDNLDDYVNDLSDLIKKSSYNSSTSNDDVWYDHGSNVFINKSNPTQYNWLNSVNNKYKGSIFSSYNNDKDWLPGCERYNSSDSSWEEVYKSYMKDNFYDGGVNAHNEHYFTLSGYTRPYDYANYKIDDCQCGTTHTVSCSTGRTYYNMNSYAVNGIFSIAEDGTPDTVTFNVLFGGYSHNYSVGDTNYNNSWDACWFTPDSTNVPYQWWSAWARGSDMEDWDANFMPSEWGTFKTKEDRIVNYVSTRFAEVQVNAYNDLKTKVDEEIKTIDARIAVLEKRCTEYEEARIDYMKKLADAEEALKDGFDVYLVQAINGAGPNGAPQLENNVNDNLVKRNDSGNSTNQEGYKTWQSDLYMYNSLEFIENSDPKMMKYGALNTNIFAQNSNLDADVLNKGVFSSYKATDCTTSSPKTPYKLPEVIDTPIKSELDARVGADDPNSARAKMPLRYRVVYSDSPYKHMDEDTIKAASSKSQVLTELTYDMLFDAPYSYGIILNGVGQKDDHIEIKEYEINYVKNSSLSKNLNKLFFSSDNTVTMDSTSNNSVSTTKVIKSFTYEPNNKTYITTKFDTSTERIPHLLLSENSSVTASFDKTDSNDNSDDSRPTDNNNSNPSVITDINSYNHNYVKLSNDKTTATLFIDSLWKNETKGTVETSTSELLKTYITNNSYRSNSNNNSIYGDEFLKYDCANGTEFDFWRTQGDMTLATVYRMYKSIYNTTVAKSNSNEGVPQPVGNNGSIPDGHSAADAGWVPVWATNPDDRKVDYMDYEVHISYQPTLKITSTFSTDDKDIKAMNGLTDNGVPYLKAGQAFEGEITGNRLIIDGYCNVAGNDNYVRVNNLTFKNKDEFYQYMDAIVNDLSKCKMGIVSTIPEFNVYTNNTKISLGDNTSVKYSYDGTLGNTQADGDAGIVFKTDGAVSENITEFYSVYDVTDYGIKPKYPGTTDDSDYNSNTIKDINRHDGCYYGSSTQSMYNGLLEWSKGTNGWYWEYSEGLYYVHYHAEIDYNKGDTNGKKTFSAVISKYNSQSTDENADDYLLNQGSVKSGFTSAFGYVDNSQYRSLDGKDSYVLAPFIDLRDLTDERSKALFVNKSTGSNNLNGILGQQTPIHIRGNVYDNT